MILVFGSQGQLGRELVARAEADGIALTALPHAEADITDPKSIAQAMARLRPELVINAAAYNLVDKAEAQPAQALRTNALGPSLLAAAAKRSGVPVIHVSTDFVFDGQKFGAYREDDPVAPLGVYGRSKAQGEEGVRNANPHHLIVRTAWLYSVHGSNFVKTVLRLAAERDAMDMVADQRGSPTAAGDLAKALLIAAAAAQRGKAPWGTYHFAGLGETSRHGFASAIVAAQAPFTGRLPVVNVTNAAAFKTAAARPANSALDSTKFAEAFGFRSDDWNVAVNRVVAAIFAAKGTASA